MSILADPCLRCRGQVVETRDEYAQIERTCLQCGAVSYCDEAGRPLAPLTIEQERALTQRFGIGEGKRRPEARVLQSRKLVQLRLVE